MLATAMVVALAAGGLLGGLAAGGIPPPAPVAVGPPRDLAAASAGMSGASSVVPVAAAPGSVVARPTSAASGTNPGTIPLSLAQAAPGAPTVAPLARHRAALGRDAIPDAGFAPAPGTVTVLPTTAAPTTPEPGSPTLTINPPLGPAGIKVHVQGSNYTDACAAAVGTGIRFPHVPPPPPPTTVVALYWDGDTFAAAVNAPFSTTLVVPSDLALGSHELQAYCGNALVASAQFTVISPPVPTVTVPTITVLPPPPTVPTTTTTTTATTTTPTQTVPPPTTPTQTTPPPTTPTHTQTTPPTPKPTSSRHERRTSHHSQPPPHHCSTGCGPTPPGPTPPGPSPSPPGPAPTVPAPFSVPTTPSISNPTVLIRPDHPRPGSWFLLIGRHFPCPRGALTLRLAGRRLYRVVELDRGGRLRVRVRLSRTIGSGPHRLGARCGPTRYALVLLVAPGPSPPSGPLHGPVPAPHRPSGHHPPNGVRVTELIPTPQRLHLSAAAIAVAALLAALIVPLLAFPAELFNKTFDENEEEIHGMLTRIGLRHRLPGHVGLIVFVLVGVGMSVLLALGEGSDGNPVAVAVGLLIALPVSTFAYELPPELYGRTRTQVRGRLKVLPTALAIAVACALASRALDLQPAYLYGVFAGFAAAEARALTEDQEAKGILVAVLMLTLIGGLAWWGWGVLDPAAHGPHRGWPVIIGSTALFWIFILSAEGLVFGLLPLEFLDGLILRRWRLLVWLPLELAAAGFFVYVQLLHGTTARIHVFSQLIRPLIFFCAFGLASVAFWRYFRWEGRPTATRDQEMVAAGGP